VFIAVLLSAWLNGLPLGYRASLLVVVLAYGLFFWYVHCNPSNQIRTLCLNQRGLWTIGFADGEKIKAVISSSSTVLGPLFFLHFKSKKGVQTLVLAPDSIDAESTRKLRLTLLVDRKVLLSAEI
jgi:hypothetical protein